MSTVEAGQSVREKRLAEIRERVAAATPGPWEVFNNVTDRGAYVYPQDSGRWRAFLDGRLMPNEVPDAELFAHAHADILWLLEQLEPPA